MHRLYFFLFISLLSCHTQPKKAQNKIQAAVVSARAEASQAGRDIMLQGGNAYDAMVATSFALSVVYPVAGNLTGGGFFVYRKANGETGTLDYREKAPLNADRDMYLDENKNVIPGKSTLGGLAVGIPGSVAGILEIHKKMGSLPLSTLLQPAIELAEKGYIITEKQARSFNKFRDKFVEVNGENIPYNKSFTAGDLFVNLPLAKTLKAILEKGNAGFYDGWVADAMIEKVNETGGIFTPEDLASYQPVWRESLRFSYKDLDIITMGPPSSGGVCLGQMLNMISPFNIKELGHNTKESIHLMVEAERRSYADRSKFLGDPDFYAVPTKGLLDTTYLTERMTDYNNELASTSKDIYAGSPPPYESDETTHFSIVDAMGNAVAVTTTLNAAYGSKVYVDEIGVFMNNEMDDFSSKPGTPNMFGLIGSDANAIAPEKRMLSSMTPTIVERNKALYMVVGTPGGSTIITSVFQTILNVYEHGMSMQEAVNAARFHHQWLPDRVVFEPNRFSDSLLDSLRNMGHTIEEKYTRILGKVDAILIDPEMGISTGADSRGDDAAATY